MLHLWVEKAGNRSSSSELEGALRRVGREDLIGESLSRSVSTPLASSRPGKHNFLCSRFCIPDFVTEF